MIRITTSDQYTSTRAIPREWNLVERWEGHVHHVGTVPTRYGPVEVTRHSEHTRLEFAWGGCVWVRRWPIAWPKKTITRLAKLFAFDIAHNEPPYGSRNGTKIDGCMICGGELPHSRQAAAARFCCDEHRNAFTSGARRLAFDLLANGTISVEQIRKAAGQ